MAKPTIIRYTSRDYESIRQDLLEHVKRYYADSFKDFNEASFGSIMLDTVAYVGDILSFYLDYQANESFLATAVEYDNIIKLARQIGWKFSKSPSSFGLLTCYIVVPANSDGTGPDTNYIPVLKKGSRINSTGGTTFTLYEDIDFYNTSNEIVVATVDDAAGGAPTTFAIKAKGMVVSGELTETQAAVGTFTKFRQVEIPGDNIAEIISVHDAEGHEYYEVDHLSQGIIYRPIVNDNFNNDNVPYLLRATPAPRRFTVERNRESVVLQFGFGSEEQLSTGPSIAHPANVVLDMHGRDHIVDNSFDPTKLNRTDKFGIAPVNTSLRVVYRVNSFQNVNAAVNTLVNPIDTDFLFRNQADLSAGTMLTIMQSLETTNEDQILGDISLPSTDEMKQRVLSHFSTQNRAVTKQDYISMIYGMPTQFGAIKRCSIIQDNDSFKRNLNLYVLSEDTNEKLTQTNDTIKDNVKNWINQYKMINDTIDVLDAKIVNYMIEYVILSDLNVNQFDLMQVVNQTLANHFETPKDIGEPLYITDVFTALKNIDGIVDVVDVKIKQRLGGRYSDTRFDIEGATSPDGRYIMPPSDYVLELKYPNEDIVGTIK